MTHTLIGCLLAGISGFLLLSPWVALPFTIWSASAIAYALLGGYALYNIRNSRHQLFWFENRWLFIGITTALLFYMLLFAGTSLLAPSSSLLHNDLAALYQTKATLSNIFIGTLLLFWITPLVEVFWRGFVQNRLMQHYGNTKGWLITAVLYAVVHLWAWNVVGVVLLFLTGLLWGWLFMRYKRLWPSLIAHAIWNVLVTIVLPLPY